MHKGRLNNCGRWCSWAHDEQGCSYCCAAASSYEAFHMFECISYLSVTQGVRSRMWGAHSSTSGGQAASVRGTKEEVPQHEAPVLSFTW